MLCSNLRVQNHELRFFFFLENIIFFWILFYWRHCWQIYTNTRFHLALATPTLFSRAWCCHTAIEFWPESQIFLVSSSAVISFYTVPTQFLTFQSSFLWDSPMSDVHYFCDHDSVISLGPWGFCRCLYEIAIRYDAAKDTCYLRSSDARLGVNLTSNGSFFHSMNVTVAADLDKIQEQIVTTYRSPKHFDVAMALAFRAAGGNITQWRLGWLGNFRTVHWLDIVPDSEENCFCKGLVVGLLGCLEKKSTASWIILALPAGWQAMGKTSWDHWHRIPTPYFLCLPARSLDVQVYTSEWWSHGGHLPTTRQSAMAADLTLCCQKHVLEERGQWYTILSDPAMVSSVALSTVCTIPDRFIWILRDQSLIGCPPNKFSSSCSPLVEDLMKTISLLFLFVALMSMVWRVTTGSRKESFFWQTANRRLLGAHCSKVSCPFYTYFFGTIWK